jgi:DNA-binding NarL/FixJ family response regulator
LTSPAPKDEGPRSPRGSPSGKIRVFIADDHAIVREGLKQIAIGDPQIVVAGEAATGNAALAAIIAGDFDVVVLDLSLPDRSGIDVLAHVKASRPQLPVLILSVSREDEFALRALRAGASGYLEKRTAPEQLITAIKRLAQGKKYLSSDLAERVVLDNDLETSDRPHDRLSPREFEILLMIAEGKSASGIAADLGLSVKTVNNHRARILRKMAMKNNAELIRYAIQHQLIR